MKRSKEKIGQLLNYEKLSAIPLLKLPKVWKKNIPDYIQCPKYEKAKSKLGMKMERFNTKVDRIISEITQMEANIATMQEQLSSVKVEMESYKSSSGSVFDSCIDKYNRLVPINNDLINQIRKLSEKHDDSINKLTEAKEEAKEALEELTAEALQAIDEDIPMVINRLESIAGNFGDSDEADDLLAAIDVCLITLRIYAMFDDLIDDNSARKECKEGIAKINQIFSNLCAKDIIQNYIVDIYRRNLDLVQKNAVIAQQIDGVLASVDQKQLDTLSQSIYAVLTEQFNAKFDYSNIIEQVELDKIVGKINATIGSLKSNIDKAKAYQAVGTPAVELGKAGVNADQQAKSLRASMQSNVDALGDPLTQNHFVVQVIDEAVIDDFYQKEVRAAVAALRKHIVDTIGEANFEAVLKGGDDRFSLKKAQDAIEKANLARLQVVLDKIPPHVKDLTDKITRAEADIRKANETLREQQNLYDSLVQKMSNTLTEKEYSDLCEQFRKMSGYKDAAKLADECNNKHREYKNRREQHEQAEARKITLGKTFAVIFQIGAIISSIIGMAMNGGSSPAFLVFIIPAAAFFCRIFFTYKYKGIVSLVLLILLSGFVGVAGFMAVAEGERGAFGFGVYGIGSIISAILAFKSREKN